jgi:hypothetical protein
VLRYSVLSPCVRILTLEPVGRAALDISSSDATMDLAALTDAPLPDAEKMLIYHEMCHVMGSRSSVLFSSRSYPSAEQ